MNRRNATTDDREGKVSIKDSAKINFVERLTSDEETAHAAGDHKQVDGVQVDDENRQ